jgi:hypothetical protein
MGNQQGYHAFRIQYPEITNEIENLHKNISPPPVCSKSRNEKVYSFMGYGGN